MTVVCKCGVLVKTPHCPQCGEVSKQDDLSELLGFLTRSLRGAEKRLAALGDVRYVASAESLAKAEVSIELWKRRTAIVQALSEVKKR